MKKGGETITTVKRDGNKRTEKKDGKREERKYRKKNAEYEVLFLSLYSARRLFSDFHSNLHFKYLSEVSYMRTGEDTFIVKSHPRV